MPASSKSELDTIALLRKELEAQRLAYEKKLREQAEKLREKDEELRKKDEIIARIKKTNIAQGVLTEDSVALLTVLIERFKKEDPDFPEARIDQIKWLLEEFQKDVVEFSTPERQSLLAYLMRKGPESYEAMIKKFEKKIAKAKVELQQTIADTNVSISKQEQKSDSLAENIGTALCEMAAENGGKADPKLDSFQSCVGSDNPPSRKLPAIKAELPKEGEQHKKTAGRIVPDAKKDKRNLQARSIEDVTGCRYCNTSKKPLALSITSDFLRVLNMSCSDLIAEGTFEAPICLCPDCGKVYVDRPEDMPYPYSLSAGCQTSSEIVCEAVCLVASGLPTNRAEEYLDAKRMQVGTEPFGRPMASWLDTGIGQIFIEAHRKAAQQAAHIGADETPMPVLRKKTPGESYLFVRTSVPSAKEQFAIFDYIPSRSGEALSQVLADWNFDTINRDGYAGYRTAFKKLGRQDQVQSQVCLVHARRAFCAAFDIGDLVASSAEKMVELLKKQIKAQAPTTTAYAILNVFKRIYEAEAECKKSPDETDDAFFARVLKIRTEKVAPEMNNIDNLMNDVKNKYVRWNESLKRWEAIQSSKIANAVTFWLNNQADLRLFLTVPQIPADSNCVERTIRAATLYKSSAFFKQSEDGAQTFANALTLRETARMNGIKHPSKWLNAFHRAFFEYYETCMLTERFARLEKGADGMPLPDEHLATKAQTLDPYYYRDFDFTPWLAWNYKES